MEHEQKWLALDGNEIKVKEFSRAIEKYNTISFYMRFESLLAMLVILLQALSLVSLIHTYSFQGVSVFVLSIAMAYLATDFFNGLVHMMVDNNTHYTSIVGPFIAAFHLHHLKLRYTEKNPFKIYFTESGHKFWLVMYLIVLTGLQKSSFLEPNLNLMLVVFGILSSVAELSHFWCHNPPKNNAIITFLQKNHLLLSLEHHRLHHIHDNRNYAFLSGISNPLLNVIARNHFKGYKNNSDRHVANYIKRSLEVNATIVPSFKKQGLR